MTFLKTQTKEAEMKAEKKEMSVRESSNKLVVYNLPDPRPVDFVDNADWYEGHVKVCCKYTEKKFLVRDEDLYDLSNEGDVHNLLKRRGQDIRDMIFRDENILGKELGYEFKLRD